MVELVSYGSLGPLSNYSKIVLAYPPTGNTKEKLIYHLDADKKIAYVERHVTSKLAGEGWRITKPEYGYEWAKENGKTISFDDLRKEIMYNFGDRRDMYNTLNRYYKVNVTKKVNKPKNLKGIKTSIPKNTVSKLVGVRPTKKCNFKKLI